MLYKNKWLAVVQGQNWRIAKIAGRSSKLTIKALFEFEGTTETTPSSSFSERLKEWFRQNKIPFKKLRIAFSCPGVITRMISLPLLSAQDLEKLLTEQVAQYFTLNTEDYVLDYRIIDQVEEDGQERIRVLLAALPKNHWEPFWSLCQELGLKPKVVDLAADSLIRVYSKLEQQDKKKGSQSVLPDTAIIHLGKKGIEFILLEHGVFFLYSDLHLDLEELKRFEDIPEEQYTEEERSQLRQEIESGLNPVFTMFGDLANFFTTRHFGKNVDRIYLTGDLSSLPELKSLFELHFGIPTLIGFPDGWEPSFKGKASQQKKNWLRYGSLYGLALRED